MADTVSRWQSLARWRVALGFGAALAALWLARPTRISIMLGAPIAFAGEALRIWAAGHLNKAREVTSSGPYRYLAHPLYVGSSVMGAGLAIASASPLVVAIVAAYLLLTITAAVRTEEAFLRAKFGAGYDRYRRSGQVDTARRFSLGQAIANREYRAVLGVTAVLLFLLWRASTL